MDALLSLHTDDAVLEDVARAEWIMRGTHLGDRPGLPATGKPVEIRGVSIFEFREGKIHDHLEQPLCLGTRVAQA